MNFYGASGWRDQNVPVLYSGVCRVFSHLFHGGTGRKTRDFSKLCHFNCLIKMSLKILQLHLLLCIASLLTPRSGQSPWLEYLLGQPSQTDFRTFYENVNIALLPYQADVKPFPAGFRHPSAGGSVPMAAQSLMELLITAMLEWCCCKEEFLHAIAAALTSSPAKWRNEEKY